MSPKSRVSIVKCIDYDPRRVEEAVFRSVELLGGIGAFIRPGMKVLIKPNMLGPHTPEEGVCTHPEFVRAAIRLVKKAGGDVMVGDSPGTFFATHNPEEVFEKTGIGRVAKEEGVPSSAFDRSVIIDGIPVTRLVPDGHFILSLPKLKTHALTKMTCAVKNMFGMVTGVYKVQLHKGAPTPRDFVKRVADVYEIARPHLSIVDAIIGMEGDGPAWGELRNIGLVIAGGDGVSVDAAVSGLVGLKFEDDIVLNEVVRRGLGEGRMANIEILGEDIESARVKNFKFSQTACLSNTLPPAIARMGARLFNFVPQIDSGICRRCRACVESCPADAITVDKEYSRIDLKRCMKCFCCYEICPHRAIKIRKNFFTRLLWK